MRDQRRNFNAPRPYQGRADGAYTNRQPYNGPDNNVPYNAGANEAGPNVANRPGAQNNTPASVAGPSQRSGPVPGQARRVNKVEGEYDPEYRLEVRVNGKTVRGLLDTGASMTCIDYDFFRYNWPDDDILAAEGLCLRGVGGSADVIGEVRLNYEYLDKEQKPQFIKLLTGVIKNMGDTLFIGRDFTNAVQATMDLARNIIYCDKPIHNPKPTKIPTLVYGKEPVEIPGKSTILISVVVEDANDITGLITNSEDCSSKLAVANSIVELEDKSAMVPITNFGEDRHVLESGEVVAQFENCDYMADDMTEDKTSNLVFKEKTRPLKLARGEIPIGTELDEQQAKMIEDIVNRYDHIFSFEGELGAVSYTHLTLPTNREV